MSAQAKPRTFDVVVDQYVRLRDAIKLADDAHDAKTKPARAALEKLNDELLGMLNATGQESAKTEFGTAYVTSRKSASVADVAQFRRFVIGSAAWDLIDFRASVSGVEGFIEDNKSPPPGVNFTVVNKVGVRRK